MLEEFQPRYTLPRSLDGARLTIRQWRMSDLEEHEELFSANLEEHLKPWLPPQPKVTSERERREQAILRIQLMLDKWEEGSDFRFLIVRRADEKIVGQIGITGIVRNVNQSAFIGYWIGKAHTNQGYATEATELAIDYAFQHLRLHRISLWISPDNLPSLKVAKKLNLRHEGCVKGALFLGGRWQDTEIYSVLKEEWDRRPTL